MKSTLPSLILILVLYACPDQLQFEGIVPPDVDKSAMTAEYYRVYHILAPGQRPDRAPVRIVYLTAKKNAAQEYGLPEWGGGGAIGRGLIVIPTAVKPFLDLSFSQITRHELVHIVLSRACPDIAVPRWFHEGVAMTLSGELSTEENIIISKAIFANSLMPLASIDSVNGFGKNRADLAYCQSHLSVMFLIDQYGMDVLSEITASARKTGDFWKGVYSVLAITPQEVEQMARAYIISRYHLVFVFADNYAFWSAIVFLFLVAFVVTVIRKRKKLLEMEMSERQGSPPEIPLENADADVSPAEEIQRHFSSGNTAAAPQNTKMPGEADPGAGSGEEPEDDDLGEDIYLEDDEEEENPDKGMDGKRL